MSLQAYSKTTWIVWTLRMLWIFFCIIAFSNVGTNVLAWTVSFYLVSAWAFIGLVRLFITWRQRQTGKGEHKFHKRDLRYGLVESAIILLPLVLGMSGVFSSIRFTLSEPALSRYVADVRAGKVDMNFEFSHPARQVGLYRVTFTQLLPDGTVRLITSGHGLLDRAGFANSSHNPPPKRGEDAYQHIQQRWWCWYESW